MRTRRQFVATAAALPIVGTAGGTDDREGRDGRDELASSAHTPRSQTPLISFPRGLVGVRRGEPQFGSAGGA